MNRLVLDDSVSERGSWSLVGRMRLVLLLLFVPVLLLGSLYYLHLTRVLGEDMRMALREDNRQVGTIVVQPYLDELERQFDLLFNEIDYRDLMTPQLERITSYYHDWHQFRALRNDIQYVYLGTEEGTIFVAPAVVPDAHFDPRVRPWYIAAIASPGKTVWTDPYYSYTKRILVATVARAVLDDRGQVRAVFAINTALNRLSETLKARSNQNGGYQMVINAKGILMAYPDTSRLLMPMEHPVWLTRMQGDSGLFLDPDSGLYVAYHALTHQGWWVINVEPENRINATLQHALYNVLWMVALSSFLYFVVAFVWTRYFRRMTNELSTVIQAARKGPPHSAKRMRELRQVYAELASVGKDYEAVRLLANLDKLTGLYNRRFFDDHLANSLKSGEPFFLGMFDLDNFKKINDTFGHQTGDQVLKRVSMIGQDLFNQYGWFCRYGGEELVVILQLEEQNQAYDLMEMMRHETAQMQWRESGLSITLSGGVVSVKGGTARECLERVDALVYEAKRRGKNNICYGGG